MRTRPALAAAAALFTGGPLAAQTPCCGNPAPAVGQLAGAMPPVGSSSLFPPPGSLTASTPSTEALDRLNLRAEWTAYVPMDGRADGLATVQVVDGGQIFVQTKSGRLIALDAATGAMQWSFHYPKAYANVRPVGVTAQTVFAVHVNTLYAFGRYTGAKEFEYDMPGLMLAGAGEPAAGPVADDNFVYVVLGSNRVVAYVIPDRLTAPPPVRATIGPDGRPVAPSAGGATIAQQVAERYGGRVNLNPEPGPLGLRRLETVAEAQMGGLGVGSSQKTPSIASVGRITPPYRLARGVTTPSVTSVASLRQPYSSYPPHLQTSQASPSIAVVPTIAAVTRMSNRRAATLEPIVGWRSRSPAHTIYEPIQTAKQLWFTTEQPLAYGLDKENGRGVGTIPLSSAPAAPPAGPVTTPEGMALVFVAEEDGTLAAIDLPNSDHLAPRVEWRANVGGFLDHKPVPTADGLYASGDNAGVAKIDVRTGDVTWRTEPTADRLLAVNGEYAYVMTRRGDLHVYPRSVPNNPTAPHARMVGKLDLRAFNVPVTNELNDRVIVGADSGLLVCLRDASAKYVRPALTMPPPPPAPPAPAAKASTEPK